MPDGMQRKDTVLHRGTVGITLRRIMEEIMGDWAGMEGVTDIKANPISPNECNLEVQQHGVRRIVRVVSATAVRRFLANLAKMCQVSEFSRFKPVMNIRVPGSGERVAATMEPISLGPQFAMRIPWQGIVTLDDLVGIGMMTPGQREVLREIASTGTQNVLFSGQTNAGKSTVLRAYLEEPAYRNAAPCILQDPEEFRISAPLATHFSTSPETKPPTMLEDLVAIMLRNAPTHAVIGEVRRAETFDLIMMWSKGHPGAATIHSDDAWNTIKAAAQNIALNKHLTVNDEMMDWICTVVNVVVHVGFDPDGNRRVGEMLRIEGFTPGAGPRYGIIHVA